MMRTPKIWMTAVAGACLVWAVKLAPAQDNERFDPKQPGIKRPVKVEERPRVDVCFVLDTTGSMGGLIEGAKQKIWALANQIAKGQPTPDVRIGLIAYRDVGDDYVTRVFDLTDDIDGVFKNLMSFGAGGGGDGPEHVNKALHDAVNAMKWDRKPATLRLVFLVGDAPPHMDYPDGLDYRVVAKRAIESDIVINTIRCGADAQTERVWQEIARMAEGTYTSIAQDGGVTAISTPMDAELAALNAKLADTVVAFGARDKRRAAEERSAGAKSMAPGAAAERAEYMSKKDSLEDADLVAAAGEGRVEVQNVKQEELPDEMKGMSDDEKKAFLAKKAAEREAIKKQIADLAAKRAAYIAEKTKDLKGDSFDASVMRAVKQQAAKKGIEYK